MHCIWMTSRYASLFSQHEMAKDKKMGIQLKARLDMSVAVWNTYVSLSAKEG